MVENTVFLLIYFSNSYNDEAMKSSRYTKFSNTNKPYTAIFHRRLL